jgi:hypothetical protein
MRRKQRRLQAMQAMFVIPEVNTAGRSLPTDSPQQNLKQMLCGIQGFSPTGLTGVLPSANAAAGAGSQAADACSTPRMGLFSHKGVVFQPLVIPVVFHCECLGRLPKNDLYSLLCCYMTLLCCSSSDELLVMLLVPCVCTCCHWRMVWATAELCIVTANHCNEQRQITWAAAAATW